MCIPATFLSSQNGFVYRMHTVSVHLEKACNAGDLVSIPGLDRFPGEGKGYPLQYSDLENAMDCIVHGVTKSRTWLSDFQFHLPFVTARLCRRAVGKFNSGWNMRKSITSAMPSNTAHISYQVDIAIPIHLIPVSNFQLVLNLGEKERGVIYHPPELLLRKNKETYEKA